MANTNLTYDRSKPHSITLANLIGNLEYATLALGISSNSSLVGTMALMINGDGTQDVHYAEITARFGFSSDANSHLAYLELLGLQQRLNTNASVTNVLTTIIQALNKFR